MLSERELINFVLEQYKLAPYTKDIPENGENGFDINAPGNVNGFLKQQLPRIRQNVGLGIPTVVEIGGWPVSGKSLLRRFIHQEFSLEFPQLEKRKKIVEVAFEKDGSFIARELGQLVTGIEEPRRDWEVALSSSYYGQSIREQILLGSKIIIGETVVTSGVEIEKKFYGFDIGSKATDQLARREGEFADVGEYDFFLIGSMGGLILREQDGAYRRLIKRLARIKNPQTRLMEAKQMARAYWFLGIKEPETDEEVTTMMWEGAPYQQVVNIATTAYKAAAKIPDIKNLSQTYTPYNYSFGAELSLFRVWLENLTKNNPYFSEQKAYLALDNPKREDLAQLSEARGFSPPRVLPLQYIRSFPRGEERFGRRVVRIIKRQLNP